MRFGIIAPLVQGTGVFMARPGLGKTYALRCFMNGLLP